MEHKRPVTCEMIVRPIVKRGKSGGWKTEHRPARPCGREATRVGCDGMPLCPFHARKGDTAPLKGD